MPSHRGPVGSAVGGESGPAERHWAETAARRFLEARGFTHVASNYRLRGGELDLVMLDGPTVVVVEVKQRKDDRFGHPVETLRGAQLIRLRRTARHFTAFAIERPDAPVRLDVVTVLGREGSHRLEHLAAVGWDGGPQA